jgi:hypothetical protein
VAVFDASTFDRRHEMLYAAAWLAGFVLCLAELSPRLTGFGLGLIAPGGGLAFYGHWAEAAISLLGVGSLIVMRRTVLTAFSWAVVAAASLTHDPHHGYVWAAGQWIVPILSATIAAVVALTSKRLPIFRIAASQRHETRSPVR